MKTIHAALCAGLIAASFAAIQPPASATTVKHVNLAKMTASAARVFRGTVTDVRPGTVEVGGGKLATTIYRIHVTEALKGNFPTEKGVTYADVEMLGSLKASRDVGNARRLSGFRDMPSLERGREYLLFMTAESRVALSSPVGLAQGTFDIDTATASEPTTNRVGNAGLLPDVKGPIPYEQLATRVRKIVAAQKGAQQ